MKENKQQILDELINLYTKAQQEYDLSIHEIKDKVREMGISWTTFRLIMLRHVRPQKNGGSL